MIKVRKSTTAGIAAIALLFAGLGVAPAANAAGNQSIATFLGASSTSFDTSWSDFDIVTAAVNAVVTANPSSSVAVLANGDVSLTAFLPTDKAFKKLVLEKKLRVKGPITEQKVLNALVAKYTLTGIEQILLYHVVLNSQITSTIALASNGVMLTSAQGGTIKVRVDGTSIRLGDKAKKRADPMVLMSKVDLNAGNNQIAHGISAVLLP